MDSSVNHTDITFALVQDGESWVSTPNEEYVGKDKYAYKYIAESIGRGETRCMQLPNKSTFYIQGAAKDGDLFADVFEGTTEDGGKHMGIIVLTLSGQDSQKKWDDLRDLIHPHTHSMADSAPPIPWCAIIIGKPFLHSKMSRDPMIRYATCLTWAWLEHCATTSPTKKG